MKTFTKKEVSELLDKLSKKQSDNYKQYFISKNHATITEQFKRDHGLIDQLEVGKWYKLTDEYGGMKKGMIVQFDRWQSGGDGPFAVVGHSIYLDFPPHKVTGNNYLAPHKDGLIEATQIEIQTALVKHWEKDNEAFEYYNYIHDSYCDDLKDSLFGWNGSEPSTELFGNGKWATIVTEPTTEEKIDILWKERKG